MAGQTEGQADRDERAGYEEAALRDLLRGLGARGLSGRQGLSQRGLAARARQKRTNAFLLSTYNRCIYFL